MTGSLMSARAHIIEDHAELAGKRRGMNSRVQTKAIVEAWEDTWAAEGDIGWRC